jgi:ubiquinone/menaquinone biosynthesis C-methylase UbiE
MINGSAAQWQLKGNAPKIYDQYIAPAVSAPWYPLFIESGLPYMQGAIADIGCGTGSFLLHLLEQKKIPNKMELVGVDLNAAMLAIAEEKNSTSKNNISWLKADALKLPFDDGYFHLVYCQQGVQYFKDKAGALREIYRVINSEGALIATVWSSIEDCVGYQCLSDAVLRVAGDNAKSSLSAPFSYPNPDVFKELAKSAGFKSVSVQTIDNFVCFPSIKEFVWHRIYGSPLIEDLPTNNVEDAINEITLELELTLKPYQGKNGLSFPVKANYLIAKK